MYPLRIAHGAGDLLFDEQGRSYIDLFTAHGTVWLGHACPAIVAVVREQLGQVWCTGALETARLAEARLVVEQLFPESHHLCALYSTGMEAVEFVLRLVRGVTGRTGVVGFNHMMHGKSLATAALGWANLLGIEVPGVFRLPFIPETAEATILEQLAATLRGQSIAAAFIEPLQGSGGGHQGSAEFYQSVARLCRENAALLVFDEILTGLYRTGPLFYFSHLDLVPDVVLIGKGLGNGFPVAGVVARRDLRVEARMLPGSTFAGNPLAAAAVVGTLRRLRELELPPLVAQIEAIVLAELAALPGVGVPVRGRGALWVVELPPTAPAEEVVGRIYQQGVAVGWAGRLVRLLPSALIAPERLTQACRIVAKEILRVCSE